MSRNLLTRLDVDVLVQLVVLGPLEASEWEALVEDADDFGTQLWTVNYEIAAWDDDLPQPAYTFTPLPITITAVEGLKQCAYFIYQSAGEEGLWERDGLGDVLVRLKARLISLLAGFDTAPAGWDANELAARAHRTGP